MSADQSAQPHPLTENLWLEVNGHSRWAIYSRLQALGIDCQCQSGQPLKVQVASALDLIQGWSVARHSNWARGSTTQLRTWLERCWSVEVMQ